MIIKLNHDRLDRDTALASGDTDTHAQEPLLYGAITGQIAVGRYVLQIGEPCGAVVREASRTEQAHMRPRPTPILLRPRSIRGLLDRRIELAAALSALDAGLPVEAIGGPGIGKTAILRHLAHHPRAASFVDGILYLPARHQSSSDLLQLIFEAFYDSDEICKATDAEIRRGLQDKQALILLDDVQLPQHELEQLLDIAPRSAFVMAARERCLCGEVRSLALKGLPVEDAVLLLERESERSLDATERSAAATLCAALEGHPLRILQAAAVIREFGISLDDCARNATPASLITELLASIDEKQRRGLLALTALPGVPLQVQDVSGIADVTDIESSLMVLVRRGVVVSSRSRYQLAAGVGDQLRRKEDLKPWLNRAITYFTAWAERHRRSPGNLLEESEALMRVQQRATDLRRWGEVLRVGGLLEGALVVGARWGAWAITLERCLAAARAIGDRSAEAWALHEIGTRAACLGEPGMARASLSQAVKVREAIDDKRGAAASRRNLSFVLAPVSGYSRGRPTRLFDDVVDLDSLPIRDDTEPGARTSETKAVRAAPLAALMLAILGGLAYWAPSTRLSWRSWSVASIGSFLQGGLGGANVATATTSQPPRTATELRVLYFSTVPDRVAPGESVRLCYEVANGTRVRIDPDIGELGVLPQSCVSVTPMETTSYMLTAHDAHGKSVRRTMRVMVGSAASRESEPKEPGSAPGDSELQAPASDPPLDPPAQPPPSDRASILIFTPRPGSITAGGPTNLCYAVNSAVRARVEPGVGDVNPTSTLNCLRVTPARTTTYDLSASGRDGYQVRQQLVIIVR
jgi:NB-ARC domain-containing protein